MNAKQKKAMLKDWLALMDKHGATPLDDDWSRESYRHAIKWDGQILHAGIYIERDPWIAARWETGDRALLDAYHAIKGGIAHSCDPETEESRAAYAKYRESIERDLAAIKSKHLPHNNPYSLKWNFHGDDCLVDFARALEKRKDA